MKHNNTLKWIANTMGHSKWLVLFLTLIQIVLSVSSIFLAIGMRQVINAAVEEERSQFLISVAMLTGILILQIVLSALNRFLSEYTSATVENLFKKKLFSSLLKGKYASVTAVHSGEWMNRLTSDTVVIAGGATQIIPGMIGMVVRLIGALAAILWLEPRFFYILVPGGVAMFILTYIFRKILKQMHKNIQEADGLVRVFLQEHLESMLIVRTFAKEEQAISQAEELMKKHKSARLKRNRFSNLCNIGFTGAMDGAYLLGIGFCGYGILTGTMSYGNLLAIIQLIGQVQNPFANITGYLPRYYSMIASAERLIEAENFEVDSQISITQKQTFEFYQTEFISINLEHVFFAYQSPVGEEKIEQTMPVVLRDIDFSINKGEYIVFTGPSGCGKSTVLKLLMCLYSLDSGKCYMKTTRGNLQLTSEWKNLFAYVPQGTQLLSGKIREIVAFGNQKQSQDDRAIRNALRIACAEEFVMALEKGLDTVLGERGQGLSEGQMQRIAIARAVFSEHPILMLDEATSALDEMTAHRILNNLRLMTDKTVLLVTHRANQKFIFDKEFSFSKDGIQQIRRKE